MEEGDVQIPDEFRDIADLQAQLSELNKENYKEIFQSIKQNYINSIESFDLLVRISVDLIPIRFAKIPLYAKLFKGLASENKEYLDIIRHCVDYKLKHSTLENQKDGYRFFRSEMGFSKPIKFSNLTNILINDDIEKLQELHGQPKFNINELYYDGRISSITKCPLIKVAAYFQAVKCFKFLMLNSQFEFDESLFTSAIQGGNIEIIRNIEPRVEVTRELAFDSVIFWNNEVANWLETSKGITAVDELNSFYMGAVQANNMGYVISSIENGMLKHYSEVFAIHGSATCGQYDMFRLFMSLNTNDINLFDKKGVNALQCAAIGGNVKIVGDLLKLPSVDINALSYNGNDAIQIATYYNNYDVVKFLIDQPNVTINRKKLTVLELALGYASADLYNFLLDREDTMIYDESALQVIKDPVIFPKVKAKLDITRKLRNMDKFLRKM